jgi:hypothetical protein
MIAHFRNNVPRPGSMGTTQNEVEVIGFQGSLYGPVLEMRINRTHFEKAVTSYK